MSATKTTEERLLALEDNAEEILERLYRIEALIEELEGKKGPRAQETS